MIDSAREPLRVPALVHLTSVIADGTVLNTTSLVRIPPSTRRTTMAFVGLDLRAPEDVRLRYKLEGFDRSWNEAT